MALLVAACAGNEPQVGTTDTRTSGVTGPSPLVAAFNRAASETGVPAELLASLAYVETRFSHSVGFDSDPVHGNPRPYGVMALAENSARDVDRAAALAGVTRDDVRVDAVANVLAAARLLGEYAREDTGNVPTEIEAYRGALGRFAGDAFVAATLADDVFTNIERGIEGVDDDGLGILVSARRLRGVESGIGHASLALGYADAIWSPANSGNYQAASRGAAQINYIVIHTTQGSYSGAISWFKNSASNVSAHYVIRSSDGQITRMVDDSDIAWHDACFNSASIGIEHEGFVADPGRWYTDAMYRSSARLTAWLADQYGVPKDRAHIQGHGETADCSDHTDPGSGWNWTKYMDLVRGGGQPTAPSYAASFVAKSEVPVLAPGEEAVAWVEFKNDGSATWDLNDTRLGTQGPQDRDSAFFKDGNWISANRATGADKSTFTPGTVGRFSFVLKAPDVVEETVFHEKFKLVQEGVTWFGPEIEFVVTVKPAAVVPGPMPEPIPTQPGTGEVPVDEAGEAGGACTTTGATRSGGNVAFALLGALALLGLARRRLR